MATLNFDLVGKVKQKKSFVGNQGPVWLVSVEWLGGVKQLAFDNAAEQAKYPDEGQYVKVLGSIVTDSKQALKLVPELVLPATEADFFKAIATPIGAPVVGVPLVASAVLAGAAASTSEGATKKTA